MPKDKGYLLPEVIDPQRIRLCIEIPNDLNHIIAFWDTIARLSRWFNWAEDDAHTARLVAEVWRDVYYKARESFAAGECASEETCQTYLMSSPRITWFPENPYHPGVVPPDGYLVHPFTVVTASTIDSIISVWGLGYQIGDVYTDLLHIPIWEGGEDPVNIYNDFPYFRVNDLNGSGTVKLHLLNLPQGGRFLILKDGVLDLFNLQLVETNKDGSSIPAETQVPQIIEVKFDDVGEHFLDVIWLPTLDDVLIPIHFGGGVRKIEICGFGLEGCDDVTDPCCPETNDLLTQILAAINGGFKLVPLTSELPSDFTVDCSPPDFDGNPDDTVPEQIMRYSAMCLTITRWLVSILADKAVKMNQSGKLNDIWALGGMLSAPDMYGQIQTVEVAFTVQYLNDMLADDTAFSLMVCALLAKLDEESNTFVNFKKQFEEIYDEVSSGENVALTLWAFLARAYSTSRVNYTVFAHGLDDAFTELENDFDFECSCVTGACDVAELELVLESAGALERVDDDTWEFTIDDFTVNESDVQIFKPVFREQGWRCFNHNFTSVGQAYYRQYNCSGVFAEGVGGGGGEIVWEEMTISFPSGEHITAPLVFTINIACPS